MGFKVISESPKAKFSACHFLKKPFKCSRLHGHNYYVSVEVSDKLGNDNFVVDFIELKKTLISIIEPLDHYLLIPTNSNYLKINEGEESVEIITQNKRYVIPRSDVCFLPLKATTSELLAKYIHDKLKKVYRNKQIIVKLEESKGSIALYEE
jgi:6-pyruvoyltetrahydropterin/6-carboxytetrahydropterin synthase